MGRIRIAEGLLLVLMVGCASPENELVGKWSSSKEDLTIEFFSDGKFNASSALSGAGLYKVTRPGVVRIEISNSLGSRIEELPYSVQGDTLTLTHSESDVVTYNRVKS